MSNYNTLYSTTQWTMPIYMSGCCPFVLLLLLSTVLLLVCLLLLLSTVLLLVCLLLLTGGGQSFCSLSQSHLFGLAKATAQSRVIGNHGSGKFGTRQQYIQNRPKAALLLHIFFPLYMFSFFSFSCAFWNKFIHLLYHGTICLPVSWHNILTCIMCINWVS